MWSYLNITSHDVDIFPDRLAQEACAVDRVVLEISLILCKILFVTFIVKCIFESFIENLSRNVLTRLALVATQPPIQWVAGAMQPEHEAVHSFQSSVEVNNTWIRTSTPSYSFMASCLMNWALGQLIVTSLHIFSHIFYLRIMFARSSPILFRKSIYSIFLCNRLFTS
jgi:hypothetical protein